MTEVFTAQAHTQAKRWVECGPPGTGPRHPRHPGPMPPVFRRVLFYSRKQVLDLSGCCVSLRREFFSSSKRRTWSVAVGKADGGRSRTCRRRPRWTGLCSCALLSPRLSTLVWKGFFWVVEGWVEKAPQKCQRRGRRGDLWKLTHGALGPHLWLLAGLTGIKGRFPNQTDSHPHPRVCALGCWVFAQVGRPRGRQGSSGGGGGGRAGHGRGWT